jgi:anaerobic magnesium-protoporphyrin IX monomethyl ester cyclase
MKVLFAEPGVKYPNKVQADGRRAEIGIRLNYALLAGYLRDNSDADVVIRPYRLYDFLGQEYSVEKDFESADVICVGASTAEMNSAVRMLKLAKKLGRTTVLGGIFPTANADMLLRQGCADYVVRGEGEQTLLDLVRAIDNNEPVDSVEGLSFRRENSIIHNKGRKPIVNLNEVRPAYDLLPMQDYAKLVKGIVYSARGCINACSFCTVSSHWNHTRRERSIDSVIEELKQYREMGFREVNFKDESLTGNRPRLMQLLERIRAENLGMQYKAKARMSELDEEMLTSMQDTGFREIHTGIESVTRPTGKEMDAKELYRKIRMILDYGFVFNPSFILGLPGQTPEELMRDADFITSIGRHERVKVYTCMYTPHPGSKAREDGRITIVSDDLDDYTHLRLVAVPKSLGKMQEAVMLLHDTQKMVVEAVGGSEAEICFQDINR